jgi:hypothetical protein
MNRIPLTLGSAAAAAVVCAACGASGPDPAPVVCGASGGLVTLPHDVAELEGCTWFRGSIHVPDWLDDSLEPLAAIERIDGSLTIFRNHGLSDLRDLDQLEVVGGELAVYLDDSQGRFTSLDGLALRSTGGLRLETNGDLASLRGLASLEAVHGDLRIEGNRSLPASEIDWLLARVTVDGAIVVADNGP